MFTTLEKESNAGAMLAIEVGPVFEKYGMHLTAGPIMNGGDQKGYCSRQVVDDLINASRRARYEPQGARWSTSPRMPLRGEPRHAAQVGRLAILTENTYRFLVVLYERGALERISIAV